MNSLLKIKNLSVSFNTDDENKSMWKMEGVSFEIRENQTLAVIGESGSGKSVTAYSILQLLDRQKLSRFDGEILFEGQNLMTIGESQMQKIRGNRISMIFQDPMTSLNPTHNILKQVSEPIFLHKKYTPKNIAKEHTIELLRKVGLRNPQNFLMRFPHELSGGERQRVMIAMAIANSPKLLIADEPTTALDVTIQTKIIALLKDLKETLGLTLLFITHDLNLVRNLADRILVMKNGKVVEENSTENILLRPQKEYTCELFQSISEPLSARDTSEKIVLKAEKLNVEYTVRSWFLKRKIDSVHSVKNISFALPEGRTLGIIGESGSGKTSLIMAILRLINSTGSIAFNGKLINKITGKKLKPIRKMLQVVFQDSFSGLNPRFNIGENTAEGLEIHEKHLSEAEKDRLILKALEDVGLPVTIKGSYPHELSGGQRQRINIARALILNPQVILFDEPTSSLDVSLQKQIIELLLHLQKTKNLSYLFISHDLQVICSLSDQILVMHQGECVEIFESQKIYTEKRLPYTQSLIDGMQRKI